MSVDPSVVAAVESAYESDPGNSALGRHLVELLIQSGDADGALARARELVGRAPDDPEVLGAAAEAARAAGDEESARRFASAAAAFGAAPAEPEADAPTEPARIPAQSPPPAADDDAADDGAEVVRLRALPGERVEDEERPHRPDVTLDDVGGLETVKRRLQVAFLEPARNPQMRQLYGKSLKGGLLLYGPPGCGKTFVARAVAGELGARFSAVGLADVLDMWLGESERKLHEIFELARRNAPCVVFLDEVDALAQKRSHLRYSAGRSVVNQLLDELDGATADNEGIFVLAATNHPWDVDTALRRPGRLDRMLLVLPPDPPAREAILRRNLQDRPLGDDIDVGAIVRRTETFSGADLAHLCDSATEAAMADAIESGTVRPIVQRDLEQALREVQPSTRAWFEVAYNHALFAGEGGTYDELVAYCREQGLK